MLRREDIYLFFFLACVEDGKVEAATSIRIRLAMKSCKLAKSEEPARQLQ